MPVEHLGLGILALAHRVHAELAHNERLVFREVLKARQVTLKIGPTLQINIERVEIDVRGEQVFRGRIARVGIQRLRVHRARDIDEMFDKIGHALGSQPADHRRRDFVADEIRKDRLVPLVAGHRVADRFDDLLADLAVVEKLDVFGPGDRDNRAHPVIAANIEKPLRRDVVNADDVHPEFAHHLEILRGAFGRREEIAVGIGPEGAVSDAFEEEFLVSRKEKLRTGAHALQFENA